MIVTLECNMIMVVKIYSGVMGNYFTVSFLLSAKKRYVLLVGAVHISFFMSAMLN